ncbi:MAG TPA: PorP/SprF family type IX secretion system membrane protein [Sphingobacteriaceae bacterium]
MKNINLMLIGVLCTTGTAMAQLSPVKSQFFQNPYLINPAMAAKDGASSVFINYSTMWNEIAGGPVMMAFSGSMPITDKAAIGFNHISDKAGLLKRTQSMGSFAYRILFNNDQSIRFGVSLCWAQNKIDNSLATPNGADDPALLTYNDTRKKQWDGNFGAAYVGKNFEAQFSYLNLNYKRSMNFSTVDYSTYYSSIAYKFSLDDNFTIKPLVAYRGVNGFDDQWDVAAEWGIISKDFNLYTMYHSNKSISGGFGYVYDHKLNISGFYNSEPSSVRGITGGIFDLIVGYKF